MDENETPFARIPPPGIQDRPSPYTPQGEIAFYGAVAQGLRTRSTLLRIVVVLFVVGFFALSLAAVFISD
jgi:hypothetical protein